MKLVQIFISHHDSLQMGSAWVWEVFLEVFESLLQSFPKCDSANCCHPKLKLRRVTQVQDPACESRRGGWQKQLGEGLSGHHHIRESHPSLFTQPAEQGPGPGTGALLLWQLQGRSQGLERYHAAL